MNALCARGEHRWGSKRCVRSDCRRKRPNPGKSVSAPPVGAAVSRTLVDRETEAGKTIGDAETISRSARFEALFPTAKPAPVAPPDPQTKEKARTTSVRYDWPWLAKRAVTALDVTSGWAIGALANRDALDAGEIETEELTRVAAEYGEQTLGKVEAPIWIVLLLAIVFFVLSKYVGAPKRKPAPAPVLRLVPPSSSPPLQTAPIVPVAAPAPAVSADMADPVPASVAALSLVPPGPAAAQNLGDGSVTDAPLGF